MYNTNNNIYKTNDNIFSINIFVLQLMLLKLKIFLFVWLKDTSLCMHCEPRENCL